MKKNNYTVFLPALLALVSLLFTACNNILSPNFTLPENGGKGTVTVSLSAAGRAALAPEGMDLDVYVFTFAGEGGGAPVIEEKSKDQAFIFSLNLGEKYTLDVKAYKGSIAAGNLAAAGTSGQFLVATSTSVTVKLNGFQKEGPGGIFSYAIAYPAGTTVEELVLLTDEDTIINLKDDALIGSGAASGSVHLTAGWYFLILRLDLDGKETGDANGVAIYSGQTTHYGTALEPVEFREGDFNMPAQKPDLLIWQIGAATDGNLSRSFVELYNNTDEEIDLGTYSVQYSFGFSTNAGNGNPAADGGSIINDGPWTKADLTGTIQPRHSFLVLGPEKATAAADSPPALAFANGYGDMNLPSFELNNRAVKVVLMSNQTRLERTVQNPFTANAGSPVYGYVDMVGVINSNGTDNINGFESNRGPNFSKQVGIRRKSLADTNDNAADFESVRFSDLVAKSGGAIIAYTGEYETKRPKNHAYGAWNPVTGERELQPDVPGASDPLAGKLLILQAFSSHSEAAGASHTFVELYNNTLASVDLNGITLYYANGTRNTAGSAISPGPVAEKDGPWSRIDLSGHSIPSKASFLVMGPHLSETAILQMSKSNNYGDINIPSDSIFNLSNRAFKVALIRKTGPLFVQNPFDADGDGSNNNVAGYIDMVGAANRYGSGDREDMIYGYEEAPARCSGSNSVRRRNLVDTNDNSEDFIQARYARNISDFGVYPMTEEEIELRRPRNSRDTADGWDPFAETGMPFVQPGAADALAGQLLILQVYVPSASPAGVSHPFAELYNNTDATINLNGITLYFADGTASSWNALSLDGYTIPAKASFLVMGKKAGTTTGTRLVLNDDYGDINDDGFSMTNNGYKIALIRNAAILNAANPFNMGGGAKAAGYIDMVGTYNNGALETQTEVTGYEVLPTRGSASEAARRKSLLDSDNNSTDFIRLRYANSDNAGAVRVYDWNLDFYTPKNSSYNSRNGWDPFDEPSPPHLTGDFDELAKKLLIFQSYGSGQTGVAASHSFVELYNATDAEINLDGYSMYYADGTSTHNNGSSGGAIGPDPAWNRVDLSGKRMPGKASLLILGSPTPAAGAITGLTLTAGEADISVPAMLLNNRTYKIAVIKSSDNLTVVNPFNTDGNGAVLEGYVDLMGAQNTSGTDQIQAFEGSPTRNSASAGPRRKSLVDTDNNDADFAETRYAEVSAEMLEVRRPRNLAYGAWDPFAEPGGPPPPPPTGNTLLIWQVGAATDGNISHSFVELYNNGAAEINLSGYSLQYAEGTRGTPAATTDGPWQKIDLSGTIPPRTSFLIKGDKGIGQTATTNPALDLEGAAGDMNENFVISNRSFKVALMSNQTLLTVQNPYSTDGNWAKAAGYVDMVGAMNTIGEDKINGSEQDPIGNLNKQTGQRRTSLVDSDNNAADFARATYAGASPADVERMRPKNSAYGAWNPVTGERETPPPPSGITLEWEKEGEVKYATNISSGDLIANNPLTIRRGGTVTITPAAEFTVYRWEYNREVIGSFDNIPYVFTGMASGTHRILLKVNGTQQGATIDIVVQ